MKAMVLSESTFGSTAVIPAAIADPMTFWVDGVVGPLLDGEPERAFDWATQLATNAGRTRVSTH
jgi:hypothetical protein